MHLSKPTELYTIKSTFTVWKKTQNFTQDVVVKMEWQTVANESNSQMNHITHTKKKIGKKMERKGMF